MDEVTNSVLHIVYNRPFKEKSLIELHYKMLQTKKTASKKKIEL